MHVSLTNPGRVVATAVAAAALLAPAAASGSTGASLRVEGGGKSLGQVRAYTDSAEIRTTKSSTCKGSGDVKTVPGATALGLLWSASQASRAFRPLAISDEFDFGLFVCGIGKYSGSDTAYWLYKADHKSPEVGADQLTLGKRSDVLWFFSDTVANVNTGDELSLTAPGDAKTNSTVTVRVYAYDAAGKRTPAAGATVNGETTDAQGTARVDTRGKGNLRLRATRGADIPSGNAYVCVSKSGHCGAHRGASILGSGGPDNITGTGAADTIQAGAGADVISVRRKGVDRVRCGKGRDQVKADRADKIGRDCEVVKRG
jgi:hypothetical protein